MQTGYMELDASRCAEGIQVIMDSNPFTPPKGPTPPGIIGMINTKLQWASVNVYPGERVRILSHDIVNLSLAPRACLTAN